MLNDCALVYSSSLSGLGFTVWAFADPIKDAEKIKNDINSLRMCRESGYKNKSRDEEVQG
jgi:hypothetical protein